MESLHFPRPPLASLERHLSTKRAGSYPTWLTETVSDIWVLTQFDPDIITGGISISCFKWNHRYAEYNTKLNQLSWYFLKYSCTRCSPGKPKYSIVLNVFLTDTSCFSAFQSFNSCYCFAKNWFSVFFHLFCPKAITHISNTTSKIFLVLGLPSILAPSSWSKSCIEL